MGLHSDESVIGGYKNLLDHALLYLNNNLSVIPLAPRKKSPAISNPKEYWERRPTEDEVRGWFEGKGFGELNIGIVTGTVSDNLVVIDFDGEEAFYKFLERLEETDSLLSLLVMDTWKVRTGKGYHVYIRVDGLESDFKKMRLGNDEIGHIDIIAKGHVVAPPSIHPSGAVYEFTDQDVYEGRREIKVLLKEQFYTIMDVIEEISGRRRGNGVRTTIGYEFGWRELGENQLIELKELLKDAWVKGTRQNLALFLSGWMARARIRPVDVARLFKYIADETEDGELNLRLSTIYYSYRKAHGQTVDPELEELDRLIEQWQREGVIRGSVSKGRNYDGMVKGRSGVQEILEQELGEARALDAIRRIQDILGVASPFRDSVFELLDYNKKLYAVANLRRLVTARAQIRDGQLVYMERVMNVAPTQVTVYENPLGGVRKYEVVFEGRPLRRPLHIEPSPIDYIISRLKNEGLVYHKRLVDDIVSAVLQGYIIKGKAVVKEEIESPGFYLVNGKIVPVRVEVEKPGEKELLEALLTLNKIAEWYGHVIERFAMTVKWGIVAPFGFIFKQKGTWMPWLYLYGSSYTGKTTLGEIILSLWGLDSRYKKSGSNIDSVPRLGHILSQSTFPVLVNEPKGAIYRDDVVEVMKSAVESTVARGRYIKGTYTEIPSLAPLIFTSNHTLPRDDALLRRLVVLRFTYGERIDPGKAEEFAEWFKQVSGELNAIGRWVAWRVMENPDLLNDNWLSLAEVLLYDMYKSVGMEPPEWVGLRVQQEEDIYEDVRDSIREYLLTRINEEYTRFVGKIVVDDGTGVEIKLKTDASFEDRVRVTISQRLIPWAILKDGSVPYVLFTSGFARELQDKVGDMGGLKSIAELLGWEYKVEKIGGRPVRVARVSLLDLVEFLKMSL